MRIPVNQVGQIGLIPDLPHTELPLNAWTDGRNVRFRDGAVEKFLGHMEVFPGVLHPPEFLLNVARAGTSFWLYAGVNKVGATNGLNHADLTRAVGGDYATPPSVGWTGGVLEEIPIINNGFDIPQMWKFPDLATKLLDLENWPVGLTANSLRIFKRYLVAMDVGKLGVRYPTMIKWSSQAPTGAVPLSWDETDETNDAGEWTLPSKGGAIVDMIPLRDVGVLYRESETWQMQYTGTLGESGIFRFNRLFGQVGMLGRRGAIEFFSGRHLVFTGDDIVQHDGQQAKSVLDERARRMLQDTLDRQNYHNSFVAANQAAHDVWVCYPEVGQTYATRAIVWNWSKNILGARELPQVSFIETGLVSPQSAGETWDTGTLTWEQALRAWGDRASDPTSQRLLMAVPGVSKLYVPEATHQAAGQNMIAWIERQGIGWPLESGTPPDYNLVKQVTGIWPRITGTTGGAIKVYLGTQKKIGGEVVYGQPRVFKIGETEYCDFASSEASRIHAVKFESDSDISWKLNGYDADVIVKGKH